MKEMIYTHKHKRNGDIWSHVCTIDGDLSRWQSINAWGAAIEMNARDSEMEELSIPHRHGPLGPVPVEE